jgi:predicted Zn finger-like uncharacterized protein
MPLQITCPNCERRLKVPDSVRGKKLRCPKCQTTFRLPGEDAPSPALPDPFDMAEQQLPTDEDALLPPLSTPSPTPPRLPVPADGRAYAQAAGIDLDEYHSEGVLDSKQADLLLLEWKQHLPPVKSAYQPSGILPAAAVVWMTLGAMLGAPAGLLAGTIAGAITALILAILGGIIALLGAICGVVLCILPIILVFVALAGFLITFAAQGAVSAACTTAMGRLGKNRNATAAALMSVGSTVLGMVLLGVGVAAMGADEVGEQAWQHVAGKDEDKPKEQPKDAAAAHKKDDEGKPVAMWIVWISVVVGGVIALIAAAAVGVQMVQEAKFCEDCEQFMEDKEMVVLRLGGTKAVARALGERNVPVCADLMNAPQGGHGKTKLFSCAQCGKGFVELTAQFKATWREKDSNKEKIESWLAGSVELSAAEVDLFKPHVPTK